MAMIRRFLTLLLLYIHVHSLRTINRFCALRHHHQQLQHHGEEHRTTAPTLARHRHNGIIPMRHPSLTALYAEMRIRIHGTKNAYTTLRPYDCVLYSLTDAIDGKDRSIGMYTASNEILPLCTYEEWSTEFYVDKSQEPFSAEQLNSENRLLRVVSCDRRGSECFTIEEYLDTDILIPLSSALTNVPPSEVTEAVTTETPSAVTTISASPATAAFQTTASAVQELIELQTLSNSALDHNLNIATARLEASMLRVQLAQLRAEKDRRSEVGSVSGAKVTAVAASSPPLSSLSSPTSAVSTTSPTTTAMTMPAEVPAAPAAAPVAPVAIHTDLAPKAVGPYSQAVVSNGFVFVSGCISLDVESGRIAEGGVGAEVRCALENLRKVLHEAGVTDMGRVCKTTLMIREMAYFPEVNKIYGEYFKAEVKPARSTFEVSYLPLGAFIEIDAIAAL